MTEMQTWSDKSGMDYAPRPYLALSKPVTVSKMYETIQKVDVFRPGWLPITMDRLYLVQVFCPEDLYIYFPFFFFFV